MKKLILATVLFTAQAGASELLAFKEAHLLIEDILYDDLDSKSRANAQLAKPSTNAQSAEKVSCDTSYVTQDGAAITVLSGGNTRSNIQCAVDLAKANNVRLITMPNREYNPSGAIEINDWTGEIQGRSKRDTVVTGEQNDSVFVIQGGNVKVARMTIEADVGIAVGPPSDSVDNCESGTTFVEIDRVNFYIDSAGVGAVGDVEDNCTSKLLGKMTINRSEFESVNDEIVYVLADNLGGGFQLTVTNNVFNTPETGFGIAVLDSYVLGNIGFNEFVGGTASIYVLNTQAVKGSSSYNITDNRVSYDNRDYRGYMYFETLNEAPANSYASGNTLSNVYMFGTPASGLTVVGNRMNGPSNLYAVEVSGSTTIVADNANFTGINISQTNGSVVNQPGSVINDENNTNILKSR